jgi:hypothetical protein
MKTIMIQAITEMGAVVYTGIRVSEDYTMSEVVRTVKRNGYTAFRIVETMKVFVKV